jgi:hypothetical protein
MPQLRKKKATIARQSSAERADPVSVGKLNCGTGRDRWRAAALRHGSIKPVRIA